MSSNAVSHQVRRLRGYSRREQVQLLLAGLCRME